MSTTLADKLAAALLRLHTINHTQGVSDEEVDEADAQAETALADYYTQNQPVRYARMLDSSEGDYYNSGDVLELVAYENGCFGKGEDGADEGGDYWARPLKPCKSGRVCIGRPGVDFEFVAAPEKIAERRGAGS